MFERCREGRIGRLSRLAGYSPHTRTWKDMRPSTPTASVFSMSAVRLGEGG
jgi:hypothetical protein